MTHDARFDVFTDENLSSELIRRGWRPITVTFEDDEGRYQHAAIIAPEHQPLIIGLQEITPEAGQ